MESSTENLKELKNKLSLLNSQRMSLEIEAEALYSDLTNLGPKGEKPAGITDPLVDLEGYPRADINIYDVKNKRQRLRIINTGKYSFFFLFYILSILSLIYK
jgi:hypothetical protein